jgi:hypothetical protein
MNIIIDHQLQPSIEPVEKKKSRPYDPAHYQRNKEYYKRYYQERKETWNNSEPYYCELCEKTVNRRWEHERTRIHTQLVKKCGSK